MMNPSSHTSAQRLVLVLNCGSSSIKFALYDVTAEPLPRQPLWGGKVQGIGDPRSEWSASGQSAQPLDLDPDHPYRSALQHIRRQVQARLDGQRLHAIGHRVVHGGSRYARPVRIDDALLAELRTLIPLAPLHQPFALEAIDILLHDSPDTPQIACFDTAFHHTLPVVEQVLPLPFEAWQRGLRRYGFHGLSYEYLATVLPERHGDLARGRTVLAHLGSGASLCALHELRSVATTMGFSALDGLMMGTRSGALDPGALLYLLEVEQQTPAQLGQLLYHQSGLLGLSGLSPEPRVLVQHEDDPGEAGERARLALQLYVRRIVREIGALCAVLGGLDLLVFSAGVGEHNAFIRERVCRELAWLGLQLDPAANAGHAATISTRESRVRVAVEPTNEEWIVARHARDLLG